MYTVQNKKVFIPVCKRHVNGQARCDPKLLTLSQQQRASNSIVGGVALFKPPIFLLPSLFFRSVFLLRCGFSSSTCQNPERSSLALSQVGRFFAHTLSSFLDKELIVFRPPGIPSSFGDSVETFNVGAQTIERVVAGGARCFRSVGPHYSVSWWRLVSLLRCSVILNNNARLDLIDSSTSSFSSFFTNTLPRGNTSLTLKHFTRHSTSGSTCW